MSGKLRTTAVAAALGVCAPTTAQAWKPTTHVVLAHEALEDARDGKVTIYQIDPSTQQIVGSLGEYEVDADVLKAIVDHTPQFYAGVIGPDAYPDVASGQLRIHPPGKNCSPTNPKTHSNENCHGAGSDAWMESVWLAARASSNRAALAFAAGMLAHGAGDIVAHTYVNTYAGGMFDTESANALKHLTLEGYLGERTPTSTLPPRVFAEVAYGGIDRGVAEFLAEALVEAPPADYREANKGKSTLWQLWKLSQDLRFVIANYRNQAAHLQGEHARAWREMQHWNAVATCTDPALALTAGLHGIDCATLSYPRPSDPVKLVALHLEARGRTIAHAHEAAAWRAAILGHAHALPFVAYAEGVVRPALEEARVDWIRTSHKVGIDLYFNPAGKIDPGAAASHVTNFAGTLVLKVLGAPGPVIEALQLFKDFKEAVAKQTAAIKSDVVDALLEPVAGFTRAELKAAFTEPHVYFDRVFANQGSLPPLSLAEIDRQMGVAFPAPGDLAGWTDRARVETFNVRPGGPRKVFPPAFNTVTMIKLQLLSAAGMNALLTKLGAKMPGGEAIQVADGSNAMLGHVATLDGSFQWATGAKMPLARDCRAFRRVFFDAAPADLGARIGGPGAPHDPCNSPGRPDPTLRAAATRVVGGGQLTFTASEPVAFTLVEPALGGLQLAADRRSAVFTAQAPAVDGQQTVRATADDGSGRTAALTVAVLAPLTIVASPEPGAPIVRPDVRQGERRRFVVTPDLPVRWRVVSGPGAFADDARRAALAAEQGVYLAALTKKMAKVESARGELRRCAGACTTQRDKLASARAAVDAFVAANEARQREVARELATIDSTYHAPARVTTPQEVTVEAAAQDGSGRAARRTFQVRGAPPLQLDPQQAREVAPGGTFTPRVVADVPLEWRLVSGPPGGRLGADLDAPKAAPLKHKALAFESKLAALVGSPKLPDKLTQKPGLAKPLAPVKQPPAPKLPAVDADTFAALAEVDRMRSTYHAPASVAGPAVVKLEGRALDDSNRTIVVELTVTPKE